MPDQYTLLLELRRSEAASRGLAKLPHDFYDATNGYLAELRRTFESELRENPSGRKGELARQTYQRASQVARDLIEARITKLLSQSFQATVGGGRELTNALPAEQGMFDALTDLLRNHRDSIAPYLNPERTALARAAPAGPPPAVAAPTRAAEPTGLAYVRVLEDRNPLEIGGETIELRKEDLLSLPEEVAKILVDGKIAERVRIGPRAV